MQKGHNSSALAMELRLFCIKPSIWYLTFEHHIVMMIRRVATRQVSRGGWFLSAGIEDHSWIIKTTSWQLSMAYWIVCQYLMQFTGYFLNRKIIIFAIFLCFWQLCPASSQVQYVFPIHTHCNWCCWATPLTPHIQWTSLQSNVVSHWLGANLTSALL